MPRTPRNPGTGKAPHNGPAQGPDLTWGGAARGGVSNSKAGIAGPGQGTHRSVAELMEAMGAREKSAKAWMALIENPDHPRHADMVAKAADRLDGAPIQRMEHAGHGAFVLMGEPEAESAEAWQADHARK